MTMQYRRVAAVSLSVVLSSWSCASTGGPSGAASPTTAPASRTAANPRDTHELLNGVLWVQTSSEFWAQTTATYYGAEIALEQAMNQKTWSASLEQTAGFENLPPAVILDLDETVLDNAPAQAQTVLDRTIFEPDMWTAWVETMAATAIPGAQAFLSLAEKRGVKIFFITNRTAAEQSATLKNLASLGITASDDTVLCSGENGWTSDKTARRALVARSHRVLLLVGDDMNDFVSTAKLTPAERVALAKTHADRWGRSWILLPNPLYGSWERATFPGLTKDEEILARKRAVIKGFRP